MSAETHLSGPSRQTTAVPGAAFDLTPTDEQRMLVDAVRDFALNRVRPAALAADAACQTPPELLATAAELGLTAIGVPEPLGGVLEHRATVTAALIAEALAEGDMGIALACLAPAGVATALGLWGDADQQAAYMPAFVDDAPPASRDRDRGAASPVRPIHTADARDPDTPAGDFLLDGVKALVPRAAGAELLVVAAELDGSAGAVPRRGRHRRCERRARAGDGGPRRRYRQGQLREREAARRAHCSATLTLRFTVSLSRSAGIGWCALAVGTGQAVLDYVSAYVNERVAFGEPIATRQSVAFMVANIAIELDGLRLVT